MRRRKSRPAKRHAQNLAKRGLEKKSPFAEHLHELRKRLLFIAISLAVGGGIAYNFHEAITRALLAPANGQQFIYTSPGGGFDFLFRLCLYGGLLFSIPVIVYQLLRYLQPMMRDNALHFVKKSAAASVVLALVGIAFGYVAGLPAALHFLLQDFSSEQIKALITIQSYMSFVMLYLLAAALLFQIPLILLVLNRIKPLRPRRLMRQQRWVILLAFIAGAVISPTPDVQNLLMLSIPMIAMFQLGIGLIWLVNRKTRRQKVAARLLEQDAKVQADRLARLRRNDVLGDESRTISA